MCIDFNKTDKELICNFLRSHKTYFESIPTGSVQEIEYNRSHDYNVGYQLAILIFFRLTDGDYDKVDSIISKLLEDKNSCYHLN